MKLFDICQEFLKTKDYFNFQPTIIGKQFIVTDAGKLFSSTRVTTRQNGNFVLKESVLLSSSTPIEVVSGHLGDETAHFIITLIKEESIYTMNSLAFARHILEGTLKIKRKQK